MAHDSPTWLPASAAVDLAQLRAGIRPALRTQVDRASSQSNVRAWARREGLFAACDRDGFMALSRTPSRAARVLAVDRRPGRHEALLGVLLGYPPCCARAAARVGEAGIDVWAARLARRRFAGRYRCTDPAGYGRGVALISHVPCSPRCGRSLAMADALVASVRRRPWR